MFNKGDKIVYPMYGAGVIENLEQKEVDGNTHLYYVMRLPVGNLTIMVSAIKADDLGIRAVHNKDKVLGIIGDISQKPMEMSDNWNQRYKDNMEKIKSGNLLEVALVFRNLMLREKEKGLSSAEKKVLTTAKQIVVSELILSQDIDKNVAEDILIRATSV